MAAAVTSRPLDEDPHHEVPHHDAPGGVHEETARLFAALEGAAAAWARGGPAGDGRGEAAPEGGDHLPSTCGVCPVCLALDHVGRRHPEVLVHLGEAVRALGAAFTALTTEAGRGAKGTEGTGPRRSPDGADEPGRTPPTERIDVTD